MPQRFTQYGTWNVLVVDELGQGGGVLTAPIREALFPANLPAHVKLGLPVAGQVDGAWRDVDVHQPAEVFRLLHKVISKPVHVRFLPPTKHENKNKRDQ